MPARIVFVKGDHIPNTRLVFQHDLPSKNKRRQAAFLCECGALVETDLNWVRFLDVTSCGCYRAELTTEKNTKHSHATRDFKSGAYRSWQAMHQRVITNPVYAGISICARWSGTDGFKNFIEDMGDRPIDHSIERKDNLGDYEPCNCVWATKLEQAQNTSQVVQVTIGGQTHSISEWCRIKGIKYSLIKQRRKRGMSLEDAITQPVDSTKQGRKK